MKVTVEQIMEKEPCNEYPAGRVAGLVGEGKTLLELLALDIPEKDRIWVVTRFLDDKTNRAFAIWCARQCGTGVKEITDYIDTIERFYDGKATEEELRAADRAADWAAYRAAYSAAYSAADRAADWAVYRAADRVAYSAADRAADWAVYRAADRAADSAADWSVYRAAYSAADWSVYRAAYSAAYSAADRAADRAAERKKQVAKLIEMIEGKEPR